MGELLCIFIFGVIALWLSITARAKRSSHPLPPGPRGWPFLGFVNFVLAEKPTELMYKLKDGFGNIFGFPVGVRYCVMLSDYKSVREGFTKKQVLDRPPRYMRMSTETKNIAEMKGSEWEEQRLFFSNCLKTLGVGKTRFEEVVLEGLRRVIPKLEKDCGKAECNIRKAISGSINNTIIQLVCSRWFDDDHPVMVEFLKFQDLLAESFSNNMAIIYYPWLDWFLTKFQPHSKAILNSASFLEQFIRSEVAEREKVHNDNNDHDYIDVFLTEKRSREERNIISSFTREHLITNSMFLFLAGTDTVRNTLEWLVMAMAVFPEIQDNVYEEIVSVLGRERMPLYSDKASLPYTEAVIMESERWKTLVPLNVLRRTTDETVIQGYRIPKGTVLINNLQMCHNDPNYWDSPKEFNPDRFLSSDKKRIIVPEYFMPFSIGRRDCPGDKVANIELFIYFSGLIQKFKFSAPKDGVNFNASHRMNLQALFPIIKVDMR